MSNCFRCFLAATLSAFASTYAEEHPTTVLPTVEVSSSLAPRLTEALPADATERPEWTSQRRFANTRVYLQDAPGEVSIEQWWRVNRNRDGTVENLFEEEVEIGLPLRMQLDLYENWVVDQNRRSRHGSTAFELRRAPADWRKIPLNPTLYAEYKAAPTVSDSYYEIKLLLGGDFNPRLHWGFNASREAQLGGGRSVEYELTQGVSYSLIDARLGAGIEMEFGDVTLAGQRGEHERRFLIGPSIQFRPTRNSHIDLVAEWGTTGTPCFQSFVIIGYDSGSGSRGESHYSPASVRGN